MLVSIGRVNGTGYLPFGQPPTCCVVSIKSKGLFLEEGKKELFAPGK